MPVYVKDDTGNWVAKHVQANEGGGVWDTSAIVRLKRNGVWGNVSSTVPSAPTLTLARSGSTGIAASWTTPNSGSGPITGYVVEYRLSTSSTWIDTGHSGLTRQRTISGLAGGAYFVRVRAVNSVGVGASDTEYVLVGTVPAAPTGVSLTFSANLIVFTLSFTEITTSPPVTSYAAQFELMNNLGELFYLNRTGAGSPITLSIAKFMQNTRARVWATNGIGTSPVSAWSNYA